MSHEIVDEEMNPAIYIYIFECISLVLIKKVTGAYEIYGCQYSHIEIRHFYHYQLQNMEVGLCQPA